MSGGRRGPDVVRLRRTRRLDARDVTTLRGIPVTTVPRTLIDLADSAPLLLPKAVHEAEVRRVLNVDAVREALARTPRRRGAAGGARARRCRPRPGRVRRRIPEALRRPRHPRPTVGAHRTLDGIVHELDLLYDAERLIVELDGEAVHRTRRKFHSDRRRDAAFAAVGYQTARFTWDRLTGEPARVADEIRRILALRRGRAASRRATSG